MAVKRSTKKRPLARTAPATRPRSRAADAPPPVAPTSTAPAEDRHERFAQEYLIDLNPTAAYRRVYGDHIAPNTAWTNGYNLLRKTEVAKRVAELKAERVGRLHLEQDRPLRALLNIVEADVRTLYESSGRMRAVTELSDETAAAIAGVKIKRFPGNENVEEHEILEYKFTEKNSAIRTLMQHMGMLTEKHELTGKDGAPLPASGTILILPSNDRDL